MQQNRPIQFNPQTGEQLDDPCRADSWRKLHRLVWIYDPWTGEPRSLKAVTDDIFGREIENGVCQHSCVLEATRDEKPLAEILELMESTGCTANERIGDDEESVLMLAAYYGLESLVVKLLQLGADPRAYSKEKGATVLSWGARHSNILQILKETNAILDVNTTFEPGHFTPLMQTIDIANRTTPPSFDYELAEDRARSIHMLLELGADVDAVNSFGRTAIMGAAYSGVFKFVEILLKYNPNLNIICDAGKSVLDYAKTEEIEVLLQDHGAVVRGINARPSWMLHHKRMQFWRE
ncbi:TPA: ankyrin repeat domain-containing protein [Pseudomonas aeruginosa]|nr:ankyrin repeat domain-containing protein [Pseudomonas aeruginosa]HEP8642534.1 ankyrin repeat domain-containing protein [Pseudomonas aeruginosa]